MGVTSCPSLEPSKEKMWRRVNKAGFRSRRVPVKDAELSGKIRWRKDFYSTLPFMEGREGGKGGRKEVRKGGRKKGRKKGRKERKTQAHKTAPGIFLGHIQERM